MKFIGAFFECLAGLGIVGALIWASIFPVRITQEDVGKPAFLYFFIGLLFWVLIGTGILFVVDAIKRGSK